MKQFLRSAFVLTAFGGVAAGIAAQVGGGGIIKWFVGDKRRMGAQASKHCY